MTEAQARAKWCPFSRAGVLAGTGAVAVNRHITDDDRNEEDRLVESETRCLASACMAWRWVAGHSARPDIQAEQGYCGLAGKP